MRTQTWEISDEFLELVKPLIPTQKELRDETKELMLEPDENQNTTIKLIFPRWSNFLQTGIIWNALPREKIDGSSALHSKFFSGRKQVCFIVFGKPVFANTTDFKESIGNGKRLTVAKSKLHSLKNLSDPILRIGKKMAILVDENGVPLSLVVDGANRHDSKLLEPLQIQRFCSTKKLRYSQNLCVDAGFVGKDKSLRRIVLYVIFDLVAKKRRSWKIILNFEPNVGVWRLVIRG